MNACCYFSVLSAFILQSVIAFGVKKEMERCANDVLDITTTSTIITIHNVTLSESTFCVLELKSKQGTRLILKLSLIPSVTHHSNCSRDYVHVGNDGNRIDQPSMTSYLFCNGAHDEEVVSRSNYLWVVFKVKKRPLHLSLEVTSSKTAHCTSEQFSCSPVQCVNRTVVCDGAHDCDNGRDEFCHTVPPAGNMCFRCSDGTCVRPSLPRYSLDNRKGLWFLCDDVRHCPDGTDERKDICYRIKGKSSAVISCIPNDVTAHHGNHVLMWDNVVCDGKRDCYHGDDESPEKCARNNDVIDAVFHVDGGGVGFAAVFVLLTGLTGVGLTIYLRKRRRQTNADGTEADPTSPRDVPTTSTYDMNPETVPLQVVCEDFGLESRGFRQTTL